MGSVFAPQVCRQFVGIGDTPKTSQKDVYRYHIKMPVVFDGSDNSQRELPELAVAIHVA